MIGGSRRRVPSLEEGDAQEEAGGRVRGRVGDGGAARLTSRFNQGQRLADVGVRQCTAASISASAASADSAGSGQLRYNWLRTQGA